MANYYKLCGSEPPWGDYGVILRDGMAEYGIGPVSETIRVLRTGPFVPPISFLFAHIIVTDDVRKALVRANFSGLAFKPVTYGKVVRIEWERWKGGDEPAFYPDSGEPEDYLFDGVHDEALASTMPILWAWDITPTAGLQIKGTGRFHAALHPNTDVAREHTVVWISEALKAWLSQTVADWVQFIPTTPR